MSGPFKMKGHELKGIKQRKSGPPVHRPGHLGPAPTEDNAKKKKKKVTPTISESLKKDFPTIGVVQPPPGPKKPGAPDKPTLKPEKHMAKFGPMPHSHNKSENPHMNPKLEKKFDPKAKGYKFPVKEKEENTYGSTLNQVINQK